ncbi:MAG TPA: hemolysin family protein [Actinomycetota bacterium]|nr:hemolysin family protein [Actinomycetota bacterium]
MEGSLGLLAILALILAHAFFVAGEFAMVAVDRTRIEQAAEESRRARSVLKALRTLSFQLSGAQLGITVTSLLVGFLIEPALGSLLEPLFDRWEFLPEGSVKGLAIGTGLFLATTVEMVGAELVPKNLAIARPLGMSYALAGPMRAVNTAWKPLVVFLNSAANWSVRRMGIEPRDELHSVMSLEELEVMIRSSREEGTLREDVFSLLNRSLSFAEKDAVDVLVPRVGIHALPGTATLDELKALALEKGHSRFPVWGGDIDDIVGIAHVKDIYGVPVRRRKTMKVTEIMQEPLVVPESYKLDALLLDMRRRRKQMAVVVDEFGGTAGIITLEDLLEEIVGEIEDEYDTPAPAEPAPDGAPAGVFKLSGLLHRDQIEEASGLEIPEGPYETLAGFLLHTFDKIPKVGDHTSFEGWELKVVEMDGRRIAQVLAVRAGSVMPDEDER